MFPPANAAGFGGSQNNDDVERLFQAPPSASASIPVSTGGYQPPGSSAAGVPGPSGFGPAETNTLDEPIWTTISRDMKRIYKNLVLVVFPFKDRSQQSAALSNWDLWGPMVFTLSLAITLSLGSNQSSNVFSLVFAVVTLGAVILTINVVLLGGNIGFFQSLCLLGYCLFPIDVAAIVCVTISNAVVRWVVVSVAFAWSSWASVPFIGGAVPPARSALAIYPLILLYAFMCWMAIVT